MSAPIQLDGPHRPQRLRRIKGAVRFTYRSLRFLLGAIVSVLALIGLGALSAFFGAPRQ